MENKKIIIVGFGWASIGFIQYIDTTKYDVILISKNDHFLYTPLLAQNVNKDRELKIDVNSINQSLTFVQESVDEIDFDNKQVNKNSYHYLILSHGAEVNTFNIPGVQENTHYLKTLEDSINIKNKLQYLPKDSVIAIIGCGLAGTELIGSICDMKKFNILAIDALERPLITFDKNLSQKVIENWERENIKMYFKSFVQKINPTSLEIKDKEPLSFDMAIWCGGIKISDLSKKINHQLKLNNNRGIPVNKHLKVENNSDIFAIGDCAYSGNPPTAQVAYQQGVYLANQFNNDFKNKEKFVFNDKGQIGYIGNGKSVYQNNYFKGGGKIIYYFNNLVHLYNFGKIYIKSKF
tara:strand:+ start:398 stop:1447 length:1050 start_codon:yes stop_codon:yes gene_type:complete